MKLRHGSLFSGGGGADYAAELAGWENVFHCEISTFCQTILKYFYPNARLYTDIRTSDFTEWRGKIDVLTGGFPCQPFSVAGKRKGTEDERHLWPEMLRAIREIKPKWVVGENVRGIINWSEGLVFEQVCADLEAEGYEVQPYLLPACGINAPHRRDRVWFVAYRNGAGLQEEGKEQYTEGIKQHGGLCESITDNSNTGIESVQQRENGVYGIRNAADATNSRCDNGCSDRQKRCVQGDEGVTEESESERQRRKCGIGEAGAVTSDGRGIEILGAIREGDNESVLEKDAGNRKGTKGKVQLGAGENTFADTQRFGSGQIHDEIQPEFTDGERIDSIGGERNDSYAEMSDQQRKRLCEICKEREIRRCDYCFDYWENFPTQSPVCSGDDGISGELVGITFSKWRQESIKMYGNAWVPELALQLFEVINEMEAMGF